MIRKQQRWVNRSDNGKGWATSSSTESSRDSSSRTPGLAQQKLGAPALFGHNIISVNSVVILTDAETPPRQQALSWRTP